MPLPHFSGSFALNFFFEIESYEKGVLIDFGKAQSEPVGEGWHFKLPAPMQKIVKVNTQQDRSVVIGYTLDEVGVPADTTLDEHLVLTQDANLIVIKAEINYNIVDPVHYVVSMEEPDSTIQDASESVVKEVIANHTAMDILSGNRMEISQTIRSDLQQLVDDYELGIKIQRVQFIRILNPMAVREAFESVESAKSDSAISVEKSLGYRNQELPKARGIAFAKIKEAEAYAAKRLAQAEGEVAEYSELLSAYKSSPRNMKKRLYLETMEKVLPGIKKIIVDEKGQSMQLFNVGGLQ